jgi:ferredoxin
MKNHAVTLLMPDREVEIDVPEDQHIWDAAKENGIELPSICHQGRCLTCAGRLEGTGEFDSSDATYYYPQDREAGYILLCTAKARSDMRIRTHQQHQMRTHRLAHGLPAPYS